MYVANTRRVPQELGFWESLVTAATSLGTKLIDRSIQRRNAAVQQHQIELDTQRMQLELVKLRNQQRIEQLQAQAYAAENPVAAVTQTLQKPVMLPGVGQIPLAYVAIPAVAIVAALLMRK